MIETHEIKPDNIKLRAEKVSLDALKKVFEDNKWCWEIFCDVIDEKRKKTMDEKYK